MIALLETSRLPVASPPPWASPETWNAVAWTMLHFLWIGVLIAGAGVMVRAICRRARPAIRYAASLTVLTALTTTPLAIWVLWTHPTESASRLSADRSAGDLAAAISHTPPPAVIDLARVETPGDARPGTIGRPTNPTVLRSRGTSTTSSTSSPTTDYVAWVGVLPWLWLVGAPLTFAWLAAGLAGAERLRRRSAPGRYDLAQRTCDSLRQSLRISRSVVVAVCDRISEPILIGIVRPMILLPPAALTGWSPAELEMVLVHELAHVRRWDNLVNLGQRLAESVLFFHPCIWLVSRQVRRDREECCDALVVHKTERPEAYASLLVRVAAARKKLSGPATAATMARHPLTGRIRKILKLEDEPMLVSRSTLGVLVVVLLVAMTMLLTEPSSTSVAQESAQKIAAKSDAVRDADKRQRPSGEQQQRTFALGTPEEVTEDEVARSKESGYSVESRRQPGGSLVLTPTKAAARRNASPFPTLEQQQAADLAYKLLGVELDPLDAEELKRVHAHDFEGGLAVADVSVSARGVNWPVPTRASGGMQPGDLLVGLHVWPTSSLDDMRTILQRDDLAELSPLRFYVIRRRLKQLTRPPRFGADPSTQASADPRAETELITGRIFVRPQYPATPTGNAKSVDSGVQPPRAAPAGPDVATQATEGVASPWTDSTIHLFGSTGSTRPPRRHRLSPGDQVLIQVDGAMPERPIDQVYRIEPGGTVALGPTYGRAKIAGMTVLEAEQAIVKALSELLADPKVQVTVQHPNRTASAGTPSWNWYGYQSSSQGAVVGAPPMPDVVDQPVYLYNGQTFQQWRDLWKFELSMEKRVQAVEALAAFARAGFGAEAAEAILDVAGQYDFQSFDSSPEGQLKNRIIELLTSTASSRVSETFWLPALLDRYEEDPRKWQSLTVWLLGRLKTDVPEIHRRLIELAREEDSPLSRAALQPALAPTQQIGPQIAQDPAVMKLLDDIVAAGEVAKVEGAIALLTYSRSGSMGGGAFGGGGLGGGGFAGPGLGFQYIPQTFTLLFHPEPRIRRQLRMKLQYIEPDDARKLAPQLIEKVKNSSAESDQLAGLRALAAMGDRAPLPESWLLRMIDDAPTEQIRMAAAAAMFKRLEKKARHSEATALHERLIDLHLRDHPGDREAAREAMQAQLDAEFAQLVPEQVDPTAGGFF